jgi:tRNA(fMet)-specific endonuclease VapC
MDKSVLDTDIGRFTISCITVLEVVAGWHRLQREDRVQQFLSQLPSFEVLVLDVDAAVQAGRIEADLARQGKPVGRADSMIAAIAATRKLPLATGNTEHYQRIRDLGVTLSISDWRVPEAPAPVGA